MPRRNAAASSRKKNAMITGQKKANIAMAEVPSSYEDAGMVDSTAVDYKMARDDRNRSLPQPSTIAEMERNIIRSLDSVPLLNIRR